MVAGHLHGGILDAMFRSRRYDRDERALGKRAGELLQAYTSLSLTNETAGICCIRLRAI